MLDLSVAFTNLGNHDIKHGVESKKDGNTVLASYGSLALETHQCFFHHANTVNVPATLTTHVSVDFNLDILFVIKS